MRLRAFALGAFIALGTALAAADAQAATRYIFTTFWGDDERDEKLYVYTSSDGLNFRLFADTGYGGLTRVLRDPTIMKHTDGKYYVAYTVQSWTTALGSPTPTRAAAATLGALVAPLRP